jgi:3-oxoacyl-[acyl-carrier protein] reductase
MMLQNKNAVIYGAGGSLGGAVAKALAGAGAKVFLTGRNLASVQKVADEILAGGGAAEVHQVDALDEDAIKNHLDYVSQKAGTVDIVFNAMGIHATQGIALVEIKAADFVKTMTTTMQTQFYTATAAAKLMMK